MPTGSNTNWQPVQVLCTLNVRKQHRHPQLLYCLCAGDLSCVGSQSIISYCNYLRESCRVPRWRPFIYYSYWHLKPPYAIASGQSRRVYRVTPEFIGSRNCVPIKPRVRQHRAVTQLRTNDVHCRESTAAQASSPQGIVPATTGAAILQVTMDQLIICASLFPHPSLFWYEVGMLKEGGNAPRPSEHPPVRGKKCQNV